MHLRTRFDAQAAAFDARVGLGADVAARVAATVLAHPHETVLELGPGTGEVGAHLAEAVGRYVAIDTSLPMLAAFARRGPGHTALVLADAARPWPLRPQSVDLVFAARAVHLLDPAQVVTELTRVCRRGSTFLVGRIDRPPNGLRNRLRRRRRELLADHGVRSNEGRDQDQRLLEELGRVRGTTAIARHSAATWTVETRADEVIAHWEANGVAGGRPLPAATAVAVVQRLRAELAGACERETETYTLEGVRLP